MSEKRALLVLGPESSGTRLMTRLLISAGCYGDDGHDQRLDDGIPADEPLIAWRRSVPHRGDRYPPIRWITDRLGEKGYRVSAVVMSRDWHSMVISQQQQHTNGDARMALDNIQSAYHHIFSSLSDWDARGWYEPPYELVNYEALVMRPAGTVRYLLQRLGLPVPAILPDIFDGNARYYREVEYVA